MRNAEVIRQWQILREIETRRAGITIHELAELANVTSRTIRRDLQALQEAGFAVYDEGEEHETKRWKLDTQPFRAVQEGRDPWGTHWPEGKIVPTFTQDLVVHLPPAATPQADRRLLRETGRRAVTG